MFRGASSLSLDVKGRLAVPAKHRDGHPGGLCLELPDRLAAASHRGVAG